MFRPGRTFEEVVKDSTFPVLEKSNVPDPETGRGGTWVTEPAVIIRLNDSQHGFTLPPTKFAALSFQRNVASTLASSPMLDTLSFDEAVAVLGNLQTQFKAGGWKPWANDDSTWFIAAASSSRNPPPSHPPPDAPLTPGARNTS